MSHNYGYDYMAVVTDGATDYYRFDQDSDCYVNKAHQHATQNNAGASATGLLPAANNNGSISFDGSTSYVTMLYTDLTNGQTTGAGDLSIECWIRQSVSQSTVDVIGLAQRAGCFGLYLAYGQPTFFVQKAGQSRITVSSSTAISTSTNYHLVGTFNSSTGDLKIYVNGSLANTYASGQTGNQIDQANNINFTCGSWDTSTQFFHGYISNVAIYDGQVLTSTQVSNHYNYAG